MRCWECWSWRWPQPHCGCGQREHHRILPRRGTEGGRGVLEPEDQGQDRRNDKCRRECGRQGRQNDGLRRFAGGAAQRRHAFQALCRSRSDLRQRTGGRHAVVPAGQPAAAAFGSGLRPHGHARHPAGHRAGDGGQLPPPAVARRGIHRRIYLRRSAGAVVRRAGQAAGAEHRRQLHALRRLPLLEGHDHAAGLHITALPERRHGRRRPADRADRVGAGGAERRIRRRRNYGGLLRRTRRGGLQRPPDQA